MHPQLHPGQAGCRVGHAPSVSITTPLGLVCTGHCVGSSMFLQDTSYGVPWGCQAGVIWGNRQEVAVAGTSGLHFRSGSGTEDQIPAPLPPCLASPSG